MVLAAVTGYVDGLGVAIVSGVFVSFMSGNTTTTGVAIGHADGAALLHVALVIPLYVAGVTVGAVHVRRRPQDRYLVIAEASVLLALFFVWRLIGPHQDPTGSGWIELVTLALLTVPMGLVTTTLRHVGPQAVGIGYVTGTLVSLGEALASLFTRSSPTEWPAVRLYAGLWLSFLAGAALGALVAAIADAFAVLPTVAVLLAVAIDLRRADRRRR